MNRKVIHSLGKENCEIEEELEVREQEFLLANEEQQHIHQVLDKLAKLEQEFATEYKNAQEERRRLALNSKRLSKLEIQLQNEDPRDVLHIGKIQSRLFQMKKKLETVNSK